MAGMFWVEILLHSICYWGGSVTVDQFDIVSITVFVSSFKSKSTCIQCEKSTNKVNSSCIGTLSREFGGSFLRMGNVLNSCAISWNMVQENTGIFAAFVHFACLILHIFNIELLLFLEDWNMVKLLSALLVIFNCHRIISNFILILVISRERTENVNQAWWSGKWFKRGLGVHVVSPKFA